MAQQGLTEPFLAQWRRAGPNVRLLLGTALAAAIILVGLTPRSLFGIDLAWPYAGLAAAVGWARVGLSIRPMLALCLLGLLQDLTSMAPLGCFVIVNLITYGLYAAMAGALDTAHDPVLARLLPYLSLLAGIVMLWLVAYMLASQTVALLPLLGAWLTTSLLYPLVQPLLQLNRRPGEFGGLA